MTTLDLGGPALRRWRKEQSLTLTGLAKKLGCSPKYLASVEQGNRPVTLKFSDAIQAVINGQVPPRGSVATHKAGRHDYCLNCGRIRYFATKRQVHCDRRCAGEYHRKMKANPHAYPPKNKRQRVKCPRCGHSFQARGHTV